MKAKREKRLVETIKYIPILLLILLFFSGCTEYELHGETLNSLDEAIIFAKESSSYSNEGPYKNLRHLWSQAPKSEKIIIEKEMLDCLITQGETYSEPPLDNFNELRNMTVNEDIKATIDDKLSYYKQVKQVKEEKSKQEEAEKQEQIKQEWAEFIKNRQALIQQGTGNIKNKSAIEVKQLISKWQAEEKLNYFYYRIKSDDLSSFAEEYFSSNNFYKIFGKPDRTQFQNSNDDRISDTYYFLYDCKDGILQIEVLADLFDNDKRVLVTDYNIF